MDKAPFIGTFSIQWIPHESDSDGDESSDSDSDNKQWGGAGHTISQLFGWFAILSAMAKPYQAP